LALLRNVPPFTSWHHRSCNTAQHLMPYCKSWCQAFNHVHHCLWAILPTVGRCISSITISEKEYIDVASPLPSSQYWQCMMLPLATMRHKRFNALRCALMRSQGRALEERCNFPLTSILQPIQSLWSFNWNCNAVVPWLPFTQSKRWQRWSQWNASKLSEARNTVTHWRPAECHGERQRPAPVWLTSNFSCIDILLWKPAFWAAKCLPGKSKVKEICWQFGFGLWCRGPVRVCRVSDPCHSAPPHPLSTARGGKIDFKQMSPNFLRSFIKGQNGDLQSFKVRGSDLLQYDWPQISHALKFCSETLAAFWAAKCLPQIFKVKETCCKFLESFGLWCNGPVRGFGMSGDVQTRFQDPSIPHDALKTAFLAAIKRNLPSTSSR
jgi:hypothetical protein